MFRTFATVKIRLPMTLETAQTLAVLEQDPWLQPFRHDIEQRLALVYRWRGIDIPV